MSTQRKSKLIGRGAFTKAYLLDNEEVLLLSKDPIKEAMAFGWFPDHYLFPKVSWGEAKGEYTMKYYKYVAGLKNRLDLNQWLLYQTLRALDGHCWDKYDGYNTWYKEFNKLPDAFSNEREALQDALTACGNYGSDVGFEISPRNVRAVNGKLLLLDCFYMQGKLEELRGGA
jgi:hypothetical protein